MFSQTLVRIIRIMLG